MSVLKTRVFTHLRDWVHGALDMQIWGALFSPHICLKCLQNKHFHSNWWQHPPTLQVQRPTDPILGEKIQGATRIGATGVRGSERALRGRVSEASQGFRGFYSFSEVFRGFSEALSEPS